MLRESTEWSQLYWFNTEDAALPRILLVGDSIVVGHGPVLAKKLAGTATVAFFATSRIVGDPAFARELGVALADMHIDLVEFNNGLHGKHDLDYYREHLAQTVDQLRLFCRCPIRWRSSTPVTVRDDPFNLDPDTDPVVVARNEAAAEIMEDRDIPVDDLYTAMLEHPEWRALDGYHYNDAGKDAQAEFLAEILRKCF